MAYFSHFAKGEQPPQRTWMPFLEELAAGMEACTLDALIDDPTRWSTALPKAARLVGSNVVAIGFVPALCVPAFAAAPAEPWRHGALAALLESLRRLVATVRPDRELVAALTGPATLAHQALGAEADRAALDALKPGLVKTLEIACEARPDLIVLDEVGAVAATPDLRRCYNTLKNVTEYYGIPLGLRVSGHPDSAAAVAEMRALRIDHLLLGAAADGSLPAPDLIGSAVAAGWSSLGFPLGAGGTGGIPGDAGLALYFCSAGQERDVEALRQLGATMTTHGG